MRRAKKARGVGAVGLLLLGLAVGCASPGVPLPPSLRLPEKTTDLTAARVGDEVRLRWTTPAKTTDGLGIAGPVHAEVCRGVGPQLASACAPWMRVTVAPGQPAEVADRLTAEQAAGAPQLLAYRVQLRNKAGRTAGPSAVAYAASGPAPAEVDGLRATTAKAGAVLEWKHGTDGVELDRTLLGAPPATAPAGAHRGDPVGGRKEVTEVRLRAGGGTNDAGGMVDRGAMSGRTYRYAAQRVRAVQVAGQTVEVRGPVSAPVTVAMVDVFPPEVPTGLVASPGLVGETVGIDLAWDAGTETGIAGYRVYRAEGDGADVRLGTELVRVPGYRDTTVVSGRVYRYRVTAVDAAGNESGRSGAVRETAPAR